MKVIIIILLMMLLVSFQIGWITGRNAGMDRAIEMMEEVMKE